MSMLQWIADIGADAEWGKGSCAKEGTIPPTKLRRSGIADPATQIWGGGRSHSPKQDPEGGGGKESEKFKKQSFKGPCEPKSGRKWLFGRRIMDSSRRCTILGMIWHPCLKSPLKKLNQPFFLKIIQVCQDDRMDGQRGNGHCKGSLDLFLLQCYDSGQLLLKNE